LNEYSITTMSELIQQQLIAARKNQILDAAAAVFAEKGFHPTTTKDIAKQAGISEGTIYNYFSSKTALLLGIFERMKESVIRENIPPAPTEMDFPAFVRTALFLPLTALKENNFALFRIVISEMMTNEELRVLYHEQIFMPVVAGAELFFERQAAKRGMSPTEVQLSIRAISGMLLGLIIQHIMGDPILSEEWDKLPDVLANLILNGLKEDKS
jgi:AcrR family transcriptional regulator